MQRNYGIDILKGILILLVIVIHICASYESETWNFFVQYLYSYASYAVPVFFIISGYYFYKSKNKEKNITNLVILYLTLCVAYLCIAFILLDLPVTDNLTEIFTLDKSAVGYLWFVKYLIYFHGVAYLFLGENKYIKLTIVILLIFNLVLLLTNQIETNKFRYYNIIPYTIGLLLSKHDKYTDIKVLGSKLLLLLLLLVPLTLGFEYAPGEFILYIFSPIIFIFFKNIDFKTNYINYISINTIYILAFHGIIIKIIREYNLTENYNFIVLYLFIMVGTIIMTELFKFFEKKLITQIYIK